MVKRITLLVCGLLAIIFLLAHAGSFLVVNDPKPSELILVLEGGVDVSSYLQAVKLLREGYAPRIMLNADTTQVKFGQTDLALATEFANRNPEGAPVVCPIPEVYLYGEVKGVRRCLEQQRIRSIILVTSDFRTRLALDVFRRRLPQYQWSVAAASAPYHFATDWWQHRRWAKTVFRAWTEFAWWVLVDRWRRG